MFLITTANQQFWKYNEPILFLGEWCKLFSQKPVWEKLSYEVLPYHWDDRKKLYEDYKYLDELYEKTLNLLSLKLNEIHKVNHSLRYWRIIVGPWLYYFIEILFDRYMSVKTARESNKVSNTFIGKYENGQFLPKDFAEFNKWFTEDDYNQFLYSKIIENTNCFPFEFREDKKVSANDKISMSKSRSLSKKCIRTIVRVYQSLIPVCLKQFIFVSTYLSNCDNVKIQLSLFQWPMIIFEKQIECNYDVNGDTRKILNIINSGNEFEILLNELIKIQIPCIYIEGFSKANNVAFETYAAPPKVILNAVAFYSNELFKFWAASCVEAGTKLAGIQHGGLYGMAKWYADESHEIKIYDRYFTWGWKNEVGNNACPLPAAKLNSVKKSVKVYKDGKILMVLAAMPRYSYHMCSSFVSSSGFLKYYNEQFKFVRFLSEENKKQLLVRLYMHDYGWNQKDRWSNEFVDVECYMGTKSIIEQLNESKLFVGTYNATTFLETFAANYPSVLFWNPNQWELRESAKPYFEMLREVGILHDTPGSAARKVNEISGCPAEWWHQSEIQEAKNYFCGQYAKMSDNWIREWADELLSLKSIKIY